MFDHIVYQHLGVDRKSDGLSWDFESHTRADQLPQDCFWAGCRHFARRSGSAPTAYELGMHVKTHLPDQSNKASNRQKHNRTPVNQTIPPPRQINGQRALARVPKVDPENGREEKNYFQKFEIAPTDDMGNAIGLPWGSVVVLRNLARNIPKAATILQPEKREAFSREANEGLFGPVKDRLLFVMAYNKPLAGFIAEVLGYIDKGSSL